MSVIRIEPYAPAHEAAWNEFASAARSAHFLFDRRFMDYHADRFTDASLLFFDQDELIALLPANRAGNIIHSHQGLTFGGFLVGDRMTTPLMLTCFDALRAHLAPQGVDELRYKAIPYIYSRAPVQEDLYALFRSGAKLTRRDVTTSIDYRRRGSLSSRRQRGIKKARGAELVFQQSEDWISYWKLLTDVLQERHKVAPTHSLQEIRLLAGRFPKNIRLFTAQQGSEILAGIVIFETATVAHAQYICASEAGRQLGALDGLFEHLIAHYAPGKAFFDFGISTENAGLVLNEGLVTQKEEFGGFAVTHDEYRLEIK